MEVRIRIIIVCVLLIFSYSFSTVFAESIETKNGNVYDGEIVSITPTLILIKTNDGKIKVKRSKIKKIKND